MLVHYHISFYGFNFSRAKMFYWLGVPYWVNQTRFIKLQFFFTNVISLIVFPYAHTNYVFQIVNPHPPGFISL